MIYVGVDLHKRYSYLTAIGKEGEIIKEGKLPNEEREIISFLSHLSEKVEVVAEATSNWYWFEELLSKHNIPLKLAHPLKTKAIASARIKTDKIDSKILAHLLRCDLLPEAHIPKGETKLKRELLRNRAFLVKLKSALKGRVHAILSKLNIEPEFSDLFGKKGREFLKKVEVPAPYREALDSYLKAICFLEAEIEKFSQKIKEEVRKDEKAKRLMEIPGIGYHLSLLILAEIGDIERFSSAKKLSSFAGLCPSIHSSGNRTYYGKITKQGSKWLRWAMIEAATKASIFQPELKLFYLKLKKRKGAKIARVAVARKLLENIYHMLKKDESFTQSVERMKGARKASGQ